jgi:STE24 endopeptidase
LVDDFLILLPYILIQVGLWCGAYFAERALQINQFDSRRLGVLRYLVLRGRQSIGLVLPVISLYVIRREVIGRFWPEWEQNPLGELIEIAGLGSLVLLLSPLFVRLALPTSPMPEGPLRRRLERIADRVGFEFTDILVWDTNQMTVNACVTGIIPGFRYVLLSDGLIESLPPLEIAAVFGHEVGHIAHRHLLYFAFFFMGSLGLLSLLGDVVSQADPVVTQFAAMTPWQPALVVEIFEGVVLLIAVGLYFWLVFGKVSRRFEREADLFGTKVVSCALPECPSAHRDQDDDEDVPRSAITSANLLCPIGIRIFATALANVARFNGLDPQGPSWRHGSIARRIAFIRGLERHPERELSFRRGTTRLRGWLAVVLAMGVLLSVSVHAWLATR